MRELRNTGRLKFLHGVRHESAAIRRAFGQGSDFLSVPRIGYCNSPSGGAIYASRLPPRAHHPLNCALLHPCFTQGPRGQIPKECSGLALRTPDQCSQCLCWQKACGGCGTLCRTDATFCNQCGTNMQVSTRPTAGASGLQVAPSAQNRKAHTPHTPHTLHHMQPVKSSCSVQPTQPS